MHVTVVRPSELGPSEAVAWAQLQDRAVLKGSPFFSLGFYQLLGRARPGARVAVAEVDGKIRAFLPFEEGRDGIAGPLCRALGTPNGIVVDREDNLDGRDLVRRASLRGWRFEKVPTELVMLQPHHYEDTRLTGSVIDLSDSYETYLAGLGASTRRRLQGQRRALERELGPVTLRWSVRDRSLLDRLVEWRVAQYPWYQTMLQQRDVRQILDEALDWDEDGCRGVFSGLFAGDRPVALHLGFAGTERLGAWMPTYDHQLDRYSPGMLLWLELAREAPGNGCTRIDLAYGHFPYKLRLRNEAYEVADGAVWARHFEAGARRLYRAAHRLVAGRAGDNSDTPDALRPIGATR